MDNLHSRLLGEISVPVRPARRIPRGGQLSPLMTQQDARTHGGTDPQQQSASTRCLKGHLSCPTHRQAGQQALQLPSSANFLKKFKKPHSKKPQTPRSWHTSHPQTRAQESQPQPEPSRPLRDFCASPYGPRKSAVMTPEAPFETNVISSDKACLW